MFFIVLLRWRSPRRGRWLESKILRYNDVNLDCINHPGLRPPLHRGEPPHRVLPGTPSQREGEKKIFFFFKNHFFMFRIYDIIRFVKDTRGPQLKSVETGGNVGKWRYEYLPNRKGFVRKTTTNKEEKK